jgi:hypothetical protein
MAWYDDPLGVIGVALVIIIAITACIIVIYAMRRREKQPKQPEQKPANLDTAASNIPYRLSRTIQATTASNAKNELRILDLEREILSDAIRRLYEAQVEGKITEVERERLAGSYKSRMNSIKDSIAKDESIIALHELESMQADLMTLFSERFGELTTKVDELRTRIDVKPIREIPVKVPGLTKAPVQMEEEEPEEEEEEVQETQEATEQKPKRKPKPRAEKQETPKTEAEKRIENIRSEVEKVLDRLGQMEIES